ncbi:MAG: hypothetical protein WCP45_00250 [Verrucomicrobiota bacterium]
MKSNRLIALAFGGGAIACGVLAARHSEVLPDGSATGPAAEANTRGRSTTALTLAEQRWGYATRRAELALGTKQPAATAPIPTWKVTGAPAADGNRVLTEAQWRECAAKVEMEANHELKRLAGLLDLDSYQQGKVFSAVAQQSSSWLPGMQTARPGTASPSVATGSDMTAALNDGQKQTLAQEDMDRQAWWAEVLPQLLPPPMPSGGVLTSGPAAADPAAAAAPPATKAFVND